MTTANFRSNLRQLDSYRWELRRDYKPGMRVPGVIYADAALMSALMDDQSLEQVANVATLPGIVKASLAMPDIHWGYGFPVGGVAATRAEDGVVSPGGVGFDINCGVRLLRTGLTEADVRPRLQKLVDFLYHDVPSGVGSEGHVKLKPQDMDRVLEDGARWAVEHGWGEADDLEVTEESGAIAGADPDAVGPRPRERGAPQLGTIGSGNHFIEVDVVDELYDRKAADALGLAGAGQIAVLFHCGSRGLGHQVCDDYLKVMDAAVKKYEYDLPDRQLACVPVNSPEGKRYLGAMRAAANFAWANRQIIAHHARGSFERAFEKDWRALGMTQVYDVAHNIAKLERHQSNGKSAVLCVHRKGATRSFPSGHPDVPARYRGVGQPVLIPGDMGRYSFVAVGAQGAMEGTFGSCCHGAGRTQSRTAAKKLLKGHDIQKELAAQGIIVRAHGGWASLAEEASAAYKDVAGVVEVCHQAGLLKKVARMRPIGVVKG